VKVKEPRAIVPPQESAARKEVADVNFAIESLVPTEKKIERTPALS
jgi:hypothetical protein